VSFDDPAEARTWVFDVTFLLRRWSCIFGRGCQGVLTGPAEDLVQGCCSYGAHLVDDDDEASVAAAAGRLSADQWQHRAKGRRGGFLRTDEDGARVTRQVDGACIFLNRPGFSRGPGCALHVGALDAGERPLDWKPDVCWQLPLRREDEVVGDHVFSTVRQWDRGHWGEGGAEFHWWCTDSPEAFTGAVPVYVGLRDELVELTTEPAYGLVAAHCDARLARAKPLNHPATRKR
jgi:hypothetical protein